MPNAIMDILTTIGSTAAITGLGLAVWLRDKVKQHDHDLYGPDGKNGYRSRIQKLEAKAEQLETWKAQEDAVDKMEEKLRRQSGRPATRLRDRLQAPPDPDDHLFEDHSQ